MKLGELIEFKALRLIDNEGKVFYWNKQRDQFESFLLRKPTKFNCEMDWQQANPVIEFQITCGHTRGQFNIVKVEI